MQFMRHVLGYAATLLLVTTPWVGAAGGASKLPAGATAAPLAGCPGTPECSGHGVCHSGSCRCTDLYFGRDCGHKHHDCATLTSCSDCQHPANTKFCGWCADERYCVPKHVHKGLERKGKACREWFEDTCPRNRSTAMPHDTIFEEWGDARSVALAEALIALIDGAGGEGASSWLGFLLLLCSVSLTILCTLREKRAQERRRRFEAFMGEEAESLREAVTVPNTPWGMGGSPRAAGRSRFQLGPSPSPMPSAAQAGADDPSRRHAHALAEAMLVGARADCTNSLDASSASGVTLPASSPPDTAKGAAKVAAATAVVAAAAAEAEAESEAAMRRSMQDAARRDLEERKEKRRQLIEQTKLDAIRQERKEAEESAREQLRARAKALRPSGSREEAGPVDKDTPRPGALAGPPTPQAPSSCASPLLAANATPPAPSTPRQSPAVVGGSPGAAATPTSDEGGISAHNEVLLGRSPASASAPPPTRQAAGLEAGPSRAEAGSATGAAKLAAARAAEAEFLAALDDL
jgi:hypothetical protein